MTGSPEAGLRRLALAAIVASLALGILVGLILGWQVWPVRWYDTDPSDLRAEHQATYVAMVADSLAVTGDMEAAKARLQELMDEDTTWEQVASLVEQVAEEHDGAGDEGGALRVRRLALASGVPLPPQAEFEPPQRRISSVGKGLAYLLGVTVTILILAMVAWLLSRQTRTRLSGRTVARTPLATRQVSSPDVRSASRLPSESESEAELDATDVLEDADLDDELPEVSIPEPPWGVWPAPEGPSATEEADPEGVYQEERGASVRAAADATLGIFEAEYVLGDDDFDCSFSLESSEGEFLGECGVGASDILGADGAQHVDAFEVWLFDKGDIRTVSKVLVSEYAYQDEDLNERLSERGELVMAEEGLTITLETPSLRVTATVVEYAYAEDDLMPNSYFSHLKVKMDAEQS